MVTIRAHIGRSPGRSNPPQLSIDALLAIVFTLQLTIFMTTSTSQYTIFSYIFSALKLRNFCNISQNMHSQAPVASQHEKTTKVVWTCKDDWPPREVLHTKDLLPKGNYLVGLVPGTLTFWNAICSDLAHLCHLSEHHLYALMVYCHWWSHFSVVLLYYK